VIVGAGIAGLACAYDLQGKGIVASLYEGADRVGGRIWSMGGEFRGPVEFPGQVVERGGELIDTLHTTMRGYATAFGLPMERVDDTPGEIFYWIDGQRYHESTVVDEFRALVPALQADLRTLGEPTANSFTPADQALDLTNLADYLRTRGAGRVITGVIESAYVGEYGRELAEQSCLGFLMFVHADRRSKYLPFGIYSNERYHVVGGNEQITKGLRDRLQGTVHVGHRLLRVRKDLTGRVELTFAQGNKTVTRWCDAVVLAIPFSTLRQVDLDASLELPAWKRTAISGLVYGTNAKTMVGFDGRPWAAAGCTGTVYARSADTPDVQVAWETNPSRATPFRGVLTDYSGGRRGAALDPRRVQQQAAAWLAGMDKIVPGTAAKATRLQGGALRAHLEHWPSNPLALGSYTCNQPGYFTTIEGNAATPIGNVFFAGEHTNSFYEWQGFMEGGALSGLAASAALRAAIKAGGL
jgi:monoamine oxidase